MGELIRLYRVVDREKHGAAIFLEVRSMDTLGSKRSRQAYIQKVLKAQRPREGAIFGAGHLVQEGGWLGAEILRHGLLLAGVVGLVAIAVGATTDCPFYWTVLNWVSSLLVRA